MLKKTASVTVVSDNDFYVMINENIFIHTHKHTHLSKSIIDIRDKIIVQHKEYNLKEGVENQSKHEILLTVFLTLENKPIIDHVRIIPCKRIHAHGIVTLAEMTIFVNAHHGSSFHYPVHHVRVLIAKT